MLVPVLVAAILSGGPLLLECKASASDARREGVAQSVSVVLSFNPDLYHVETRGADFRTSTTGVGSTDAEWWWDDWRDQIPGRSWINRKTLAYRVKRGGESLVGQCRETRRPLWPWP